MENFNVKNDIELFCIKADSFPAGIESAHKKLVSIARPPGRRNYFGISYLYDDNILYMAAAEKKAGESVPKDCYTYLLRRGNYISICISDFAKDPSQIKKAFKTLLDDPRIDENGCCAECYFPEGANPVNAIDVRCMVRFAD